MRRNSGVILRQVHALLDVGTFGGLSDRQLLDRFLARHDQVSELAFTVLVERHGPMVLGVCRRILVDPHDAEDAFQATFLILVRKAGSVRVDGSVGRWLFGVATRVATRARADARRRRGRERPGLDRLRVVSVQETLPAVERADLRSIVAEEIGRLPARLQVPVILCDLEGCSYERAGEQLGWPIGTVKSRLSRARALLRTRLTHRGLGPEDLAINAPLLSTTLSRGLIQGTTRAAQSLIAARLTTVGIVPVSVATLTEGVLRTMFWTKFKLAIAATLLIMGGSAVVFSQATTEKLASRPDAGTGPAAPAGGADQSTARGDELDVLMLDRAWVDAIPRRDVAMVNRILADDFEGIDTTGKPFTKATYLPDLRDGAFGVQPIELDEIKTRLFGETAVVTSRIKIAGHPTRGRMTNVYVKRQGRWQCVASHASGIDGFGVFCPVTDFPVQQLRTRPNSPGSLGNSCIDCHAVNHQAKFLPPQTRDRILRALAGPDTEKAKSQQQGAGKSGQNNPQPQDAGQSSQNNSQQQGAGQPGQNNSQQQDASQPSHATGQGPGQSGQGQGPGQPGQGRGGQGQRGQGQGQGQGGQGGQGQGQQGQGQGQGQGQQGQGQRQQGQGQGQDRQGQQSQGQQSRDQGQPGQNNPQPQQGQNGAQSQQGQNGAQPRQGQNAAQSQGQGQMGAMMGRMGGGMDNQRLNQPQMDRMMGMMGNRMNMGVGTIGHSQAKGQGKAMNRTAPGQEPTEVRLQFGFRVEKVLVEPGQRVKTGDPLFQVFSTELMEAKSNYEMASSQWSHDKKIYDYKAPLAKENTLSRKELIDVENNEAQSRLKMRLAKDKLLIFGLTEEDIKQVPNEEGESRARYRLRSRVDGRVATMRAAAGETYNAGDVLMVIEPTSPAEPAGR
jgi:RNA polymerase sigma factor (sigma-70 family)